MDLSHLPSLLASLAGSAVGAFVLVVIVDDLLGVLAAVKSHTFDIRKLPSFVESQYGSRAAITVAGLVAAVYFASPSAPDLKNALLVALTSAAAAQTAPVLADIKGKLGALIAPPAKPAAPAA